MKKRDGKTKRGCRAAALLLCVLCFLWTPMTSFAAETETGEADSAPAAGPDAPEGIGAAFVYNIENQQVIYEYESRSVMYPAASVKVLDAIVAYDLLRDRMDERVTVTKDMIRGVTGSNIALEAGEILTVRDLFAAMLLKGANDAVSVLAHLCCEGVPAFVERLNGLASELGMTSSHFTNPTGLHDPEMVTTAGDMALAGLRFASYPELMSLSSQSKYTIEKSADCAARNIYTRNAFVSRLNTIGVSEYYFPEAEGICFGSTEEGGDSFLTVGERDGLSYLCVILGGKEDGDMEGIHAFYEAKKLLTYALDEYGYRRVLTADQRIYDMPVSLSDETDHVILIPSTEIRAYLPMSLDLDTALSRTVTLDATSLTAPVGEGQKVGYISVYRGETLLGTAELVTQNGVERSAFLYTLETIKNFTRGKFFLCTLIALVVVSVAAVLLKAYVRGRRQRRRQGRFK